jgi:peptidylprolyl isomerase
MNNRGIVLAAAALAVTALGGCLGDSTGPQQCETPAFQVGMQGDTTTSTSGLRFIDTVVGTGAPVAAGTQVQLRYTGLLTGGQQFDAGTLSFTPGQGQLIPGFEQGVIGTRGGGQRRLIVPPQLAYGSNAIRNQQTGAVLIPACSTLIFDIEIVSPAGA